MKLNYVPCVCVDMAINKKKATAFMIIIYLKLPFQQDIADLNESTV